jgi:hypothetical protein
MMVLDYVSDGSMRNYSDTDYNKLIRFFTYIKFYLDLNILMMMK